MLPNLDMKMAELLDADFSLCGVFSRMGLNYGVADASVEEVCRRQGVDPETFLLICRVYASDNFRPDAAALEKADAKEIVNYLSRSHSYYMEVALQSLEDGLRRVVQTTDERSRGIIRKFFTDYKEELARHFEYEEQNVFPYVETGVSANFKVDEFEDTHESVEEKLEDLKNLLIKYMPEGSDQKAAAWTMQQLLMLGSDIQKHIILEDAILAPKLRPRDRERLEAKFEAAATESDLLTAREKEILVCVAKGMLNKEIADLCNLSIHTVISHRKNITRKTGIKTVAGLTVYALLNNLIDMNSIE